VYLPNLLVVLVAYFTNFVGQCINELKQFIDFMGQSIDELKQFTYFMGQSIDELKQSIRVN